MIVTVLVNELTNLISEAKRKHGELKAAAEKSLQELKSIPSTSDDLVVEDLRRRPTLVDPFVIACATRHAKYAVHGVTGLQHLIVAKALPSNRLGEALEAFNTCTSLSSEAQIKVLQALPSLLQNYAVDIEGELLAGAIQVAASLHEVKTQTISGVAAASLQQLITVIFDKVAREDKSPDSDAETVVISAGEGELKLQLAAHDAYRVFRDLALAGEGRPTKFVTPGHLSADSSLELIRSAMNTHPRIFTSHPELESIIRSNVLPLVIRALTETSSYPWTIRILRIVDLLFAHSLMRYAEESEVILGLMGQSLDSENTPLWKRSMILEILRHILAKGPLIMDAYARFDCSESGKTTIQDLLATFVRVSSEKPAAIGLSHTSTVPVASSSQGQRDDGDYSIDAVSGVAGIISASRSSLETQLVGISSQWSIPRVASLDQLDKQEPPFIPETYIYALLLDCLSNLSDGLARIILPLTVHQDSRETPEVPCEHANASEKVSSTRQGRSQSFRRLAIPLDATEDGSDEPRNRPRIVARFIQDCWPAILATSSTFLNSALEEQYYRNLIKAFQRFVQIAGLLDLDTARDALMTTLSKSAVPPHVLNAAMSEIPKSPIPESPSAFSSAKALLGVDNLVSSAFDRDRRASGEATKPILSARNLLCLRALINIAIALGPTLGIAFDLVLDALRQADMIIRSPHHQQQLARKGPSSSQNGSETSSSGQNLTAEISAVEGAASRLLESTVDYPDAAFLNILEVFCRLLAPPRRDSVSTTSDSRPITPITSPKTRSLSGLPGIALFTENRARDYEFALPKLGHLAVINVSRFAWNDPRESGWDFIVSELLKLALNPDTLRPARQSAAESLCRLATKMVAESLASMQDEDESRANVQVRGLDVLCQISRGISSMPPEHTATDNDIHQHVLDTLRSLLEHSGDNLSAGWTSILRVIGTCFRSAVGASDEDASSQVDYNRNVRDFWSIAVGRSAFSAAQLLCSDFAESLPGENLPSLIEILSQFMIQEQDLNIGLTAITLSWNLSDAIVATVHGSELRELSYCGPEPSSFLNAVNQRSTSSSAARLLLLLAHLRNTACYGQKEVRNAAFQTVCSIFKNHGDRFDPETWASILRHILLSICSDDAYTNQESYHNDTVSNDLGHQESADYGLSKTFIAGCAEVFAQHLRTIEQAAKFTSLWECFLNTMEIYLELGVLDVDAEVYLALSKVLAHVDLASKVWTAPGYRAMSLWLNQFPDALPGQDADSSNQDAFAAYLEAGQEIYRLTCEGIGTSQLRKVVENTRRCIAESNGPKHGADINTMSSVQIKAMNLLKNFRGDLTNMASCLLGVAAQIATLHHEKVDSISRTKGPSFVAVVWDTITWIETLVNKYIGDSEIIESGALLSSLQALRKLVVSKYTIPAEHKGSSLWRMATTVALRLAPSVIRVVDQLDRSAGNANTRTACWAEYVAITRGILAAKGLDHHNGSAAKVHDDQIEDIESFKTLSGIMIPGLGSDSLPDMLRSDYCIALFDASIVHPETLIQRPPCTASELKSIDWDDQSRLHSMPRTQRERISYVCFEHLIDLASGGGESNQRMKLAQAAAPVLVMRLAMPIRRYIADQPLQGRKPQPLSQVQELLFCFEQIKRLRLTAAVLGKEQGHLQYLQPLLVQAIGVAGDSWSGSDEVLQPLQALLQAVVGRNE